jgi:hypothetical protein
MRPWTSVGGNSAIRPSRWTGDSLPSTAEYFGAFGQSSIHTGQRRLFLARSMAQPFADLLFFSVGDGRIMRLFPKTQIGGRQRLCISRSSSLNMLGQGRLPVSSSMGASPTGTVLLTIRCTTPARSRYSTYCAGTLSVAVDFVIQTAFAE